METRFEFIHFSQLGSTGKTTMWACYNNRSDGNLGTVRWYGPWRQYCFLPAPDCVFSSGCLKDIDTFVDQLMAARRK